MFLLCQMRKMEDDYKQHKDNIFYKSVVMRLSKRLDRALKKHRNHVMVFVSTPTERQFGILRQICDEYHQAGYVAELKNVNNSDDVYINITW